MKFWNWFTEDGGFIPVLGALLMAAVIFFYISDAISAVECKNKGGVHVENVCIRAEVIK